MNGLVMSTENMENIWLVICSASRWEIFQSFNEDEYLRKSLSKASSSDFLIKWAQCFLARSYSVKDAEKKRWKRLLKEYIDRLQNPQHMTDILRAIDEILDVFQESPDSQWHCSEFINNIVDLCFQSKLNIYSVIANSLIHVQNEKFRTQFRNTFDSKVLLDKKKILKVMTNTDNPLVALIELDKRQTDRKSILIQDLLELTCEKISITTKELLEHTFEQPTRSSITYYVLFDETLTSLPIHTKLLDQLRFIWEKWGNEGFLVTEINIWCALEESNKQLVRQIWNYVTKYSNKSTDLQQLIDTARAEIEEITKTIENVSLCIKYFCYDATDQIDYLTDLQDIEKQMNEATTKTVKMSPKLQELKPFADRIKPLTESTVWQEYLRSKHSSFQDSIYLIYYRFRPAG